MLELVEFRKEYDSVIAVSDSTFSVSSHEVFGLVGPNGAGKTTTLKAIVGLLEPTHGTVRFDGRSPTIPAVRERIGWLPEETSLYEDMTPESYLRFFADLYNVSRTQADRRITDILDRLDLAVRDRRLGDCSKGMRRKVAMARALINDPDLVVFDEPASGLDPLTTREVISVTRDLADQGKTVVFSAHDLHHVEQVCDRVAVMADGANVAEGTLPEIRADHGSTTYHVYTTVPVEGGTKSGDRYRVDLDDPDEIPTVRAAAEAGDGRVADVRTTEPSLEDVFLSITG